MERIDPQVDKIREPPQKEDSGDEELIHSCSCTWEIKALLFGLEKIEAACHQYKEKGCHVIQVNHHKPHSILQEKFGQWSWWSQAASGIDNVGGIRLGINMCHFESILQTLQAYESYAINLHH